MAEGELQDETLTCGDCGIQFTFTTREQVFYRERGFVPPRRCRICREKRKSSPHGIPKLGASPPTSGHSLAPPPGADGRQYYQIICAACGVETTVPFKPDPQRPAFCRKCYVGRKRDSSGERTASSGS